jgi:hypothetical protein
MSITTQMIGFCLLASLVSGCATLSNRQKALITMGVAGTTAGVIGVALAPEGENPVAHGVLWGGGTAAVVGALSLFVFDEEARRKQAETQVTKLERELLAFREQTEPELIASSQIGLSKPLPEKFKKLITPGQWSLYQVDRWVSTSDSELVHQDHIFRFSQPQLNPAGAMDTNEQNKGENIR